MPGKWNCSCHHAFLSQGLHQNTSGIVVPHGQEGWRRGWKRLVLHWHSVFGLQGCVTRRRKISTPFLNHRLKSSQNIKRKGFFFSFVSGVPKEQIVSVAIPISFHCLLSLVNNLTVTLLCRSYTITAFSNRVEKSNNTKVHVLKKFAKNLFSIIQITESSEEKKLLPSLGL